MCEIEKRAYDSAIVLHKASTSAQHNLLTIYLCDNILEKGNVQIIMTVA